ncbi:MAG: mechanosensitive ion channel [Rikenellaceae bacterium]
MAFDGETGAAAVADSVVNFQDKLMDFARNVSNMSTEELISWGLSSVVGILSKVILAVAVYCVGRWLIRKLLKIMRSVFDRRNLEISLNRFIVSLVNTVLSIILILTTIGILGINTTSFLAIFASAGLAIGMALSGTLQNFAGGVLILFLKPFKVGDWIEAQGFSGTVKEISLFSTLLNTVDNKMVIIPNGELSNEAIYNYSKESTRRVVWNIGVAYGSDYGHVRSVLMDILRKNDKILQDEDIFIALNQMGDSSLDIMVRVWCNSADYWTVYFGVNQAVYERFNSEGIEFPFPQMDVHLSTKKQD